MRLATYKFYGFDCYASVNAPLPNSCVKTISNMIVFEVRPLEVITS
jgi:hypothetical protein